MKICIYGGQFGSEGKGSIAEAFIRRRPYPDRLLVVFGDNSPNSGHTNSLGKTRNIPVSSFYADMVILGPDSVIDLECLIDDIQKVLAYRSANHNSKPFQIYIHENAALVSEKHRVMESDLVGRVSSTGTGSGAARFDKQFNRLVTSTIGYAITDSVQLAQRLSEVQVSVVGNPTYIQLVDGCHNHDCLFECSQGALLDVNFGYFPFTTSRSTLARVSIERNGLGSLNWRVAGVYRTYPIRTGGPSGPTGGGEITFEKIGVDAEIATVTKRKRRVFEFSQSDFLTSAYLNRPDYIAFTHLDYIGLRPDNFNGFLGWLSLPESHDWLASDVTWVLSNETGKAVFHE
jgi:adenylosuccinate synthase